MSNLVQKIQLHRILYGNDFVIFNIHISVGIFRGFILRYYRRTNSAVNYHFDIRK